MVTSAPGNFIARDAIRRAWGADLPKGWSLVFFLGQSFDSDIQVITNSYLF